MRPHRPNHAAASARILAALDCLWSRALAFAVQLASAEQGSHAALPSHHAIKYTCPERQQSCTFCSADPVPVAVPCQHLQHSVALQILAGQSCSQQGPGHHQACLLVPQPSPASGSLAAGPSHYTIGSCCTGNNDASAAGQDDDDHLSSSNSLSHITGATEGACSSSGAKQHQGNTPTHRGHTCMHARTTTACHIASTVPSRSSSAGCQRQAKHAGSCTCCTTARCHGALTHMAAHWHRRLDLPHPSLLPQQSRCSLSCSTD
jgi:hypothetical protein